MRRHRRATTGAVLPLAMAGILATACGSDPGIARGAELFGRHCAACHAADAGGNLTGPSLLTPQNAPTALSDADFARIVTEGLPGSDGGVPMAPIVGLDAGEIADVRAWLTEQQRAAGVE